MLRWPCDPRAHWHVLSRGFWYGNSVDTPDCESWCCSMLYQYLYHLLNSAIFSPSIGSSNYVTCLTSRSTGFGAGITALHAPVPFRLGSCLGRFDLIGRYLHRTRYVYWTASVYTRVGSLNCDPQWRFDQNNQTRAPSEHLSPRSLKLMHGIEV